MPVPTEVRAGFLKERSHTGQGPEPEPLSTCSARRIQAGMRSTRSPEGFVTQI